MAERRLNDPANYFQVGCLLIPWPKAWRALRHLELDIRQRIDLAAGMKRHRRWLQDERLERERRKEAARLWVEQRRNAA